MNKTLKWVLIGLAIAFGAFLIALPIFSMILGVAGRGYSMGGRFTHGPMMLPFGGLFMFFRFLLPLGVVALAVVGIVLLVRNNRGQILPPVPPAQPAQSAQPAQPMAPPRICINCGKILNAEGEYCQYCGTKQ